MLSTQGDDDWEISNDGLYIATRGFLARRGYCCANKCRNCPYINWHHLTNWQPIPVRYVRHVRVSAKAVAAARIMHHYHEQQLQASHPEAQQHHLIMSTHYAMLLEHWGEKL